MEHALANHMIYGDGVRKRYNLTLSYSLCQMTLYKSNLIALCGSVKT